MSDIKVGSYVGYTTEAGLKAVYLVVDLLSDEKVRIINPSLNGSNKNKVVRKDKLTIDSKWPEAKAVVWKGIVYLVTTKLNIISLRTFKVMNWPDSHGSRKAILEIYREHTS